MKKILSIAFVFLIAVLLQTSLIIRQFYFLIKPDIILLLLLYIGFYQGALTGQIVGFFAGFALDFLSASPFGFYALIYCIVGFISGLFYQKMYTRGFFIPFFIGIFGTLLKTILISIIGVLYPTVLIPYTLISLNLMKETVLNGLLNPLIFWFLSLFTLFNIDKMGNKIN